MNLSANYFELFNLPLRFALDRAALDRAYHEIQGQVHPDRFASASEAEQRVSMQWATRANEAYGALKVPLLRARYLVELAGGDVGAENNTAMPVDFLIEQMEWREAADEARQAGDVRELEHLDQRLRTLLDARYSDLGKLFDAPTEDLFDNFQKNGASAAQEVRKLMFLEKLQSDLDEALIELDDLNA